MVLCYFHFRYLKSILAADLPNQLFRSFPDLFLHKYILSTFRTPYQMVVRIVNRMTRPLQSHAYRYTIARKGLCGLRRLPVSLITLWARHAFIPVASHGAFCKVFRKNTISPIPMALMSTVICFYPNDCVTRARKDLCQNQTSVIPRRCGRAC